MILKIRKANDPILREPTENVADFGHEFQFLIDNMIETMRKNKGVGLAAPQIGINKKIFICEFNAEDDDDFPSFPLTVLCNPEIVWASDENKNMVEGCLSFPGLELLIKRPKKIKIKAQDRYGKKFEIDADNLYARVLQHENDHLNSTLFIDHLQETKIIFIGTGTLGKKSLELLANDPQYKIAAVITGARKKSVNRKNEETGNPILETAKKLNLPIIETENINDPKIIEKIKKLQPELGIMADFGQIVSEKILAIPRSSIINIHPSLLPRHRGPSPIQATILAGDRVSGVSLIITSAKMDAGDILSQVAVDLTLGETASTLKEYLSEIGANLLLNSIPYYLAGDLKPIPQKEDRATYTKLVKSNFGLVDETTPAIDVERKIRAYDIWPKVYAIINDHAARQADKRIQILAAHFDEANKLIIDRVKPESKKEMSYEEFLRGYKKKLTFK